MAAAAALWPRTRRAHAFAALEDAGFATCGLQAAGAGGGSGSGSVRRSRSLSRFPSPVPSPDDAVTLSSRFVNKVRGGSCGGGFPLQVSLDNRADEIFGAKMESEDDDDEETAARACRLPECCGSGEATLPERRQDFPTAFRPSYPSPPWVRWRPS